MAMIDRQQIYRRCIIKENELSQGNTHRLYHTPAVLLLILVVVVDPDQVSSLTLLVSVTAVNLSFFPHFTSFHHFNPIQHNTAQHNKRCGPS